VAEFALGDPQLEQEVVGLPDQRALGHAEDAHDLVAIELRPDPGQLLLLAQLGDAPLEVVVDAGQPLRLRAIPRRAIGPGQHVQAGEQGPGVANVPANRRVRPLTLGVTMEPQVQRDELGGIPHHVVREAQRGQPALGHRGADDLVQVERDPAAGQPRPGLGLADVVQQRGQPDPQVALQPVTRLQLDRLPEHRQAVLVDILMPVVLVRLHPEAGHLGQHLLGDVGLHQDVDAQRRVVREHQLLELAGDPLGGDDLQPGRLLGHGRPYVRGDREPELGREPGRAQDPERIVAERVLRPSRGPQHPLAERVQAAERIDELVVGQPGRHRVDREIAPAQVLHEGPPVPHVGLARGGLVLLAAVGSDLEGDAALAQADGAEGDPDGPHVIGPPADQIHDLLRRGVGGQVEIGGPLAEEHVPDRPADQG